MAKSTVIIRFHILYILDLLSSLVSILKTIVRRYNLSNSYNQTDTWQRVCPRALLFNLTIILGEQGFIQSGDPKLIKFQWEKFFMFNTNFYLVEMWFFYLILKCLTKCGFCSQRWAIWGFMLCEGYSVTCKSLMQSMYIYEASLQFLLQDIINEFEMYYRRHLQPSRCRNPLLTSTLPAFGTTSFPMTFWNHHLYMS